MYSEGNLHVIINSDVNGFKSCHKYVRYSVFFLTNIQVQQVCMRRVLKVLCFGDDCFYTQQILEYIFIFSINFK